MRQPWEDKKIPAWYENWIGKVSPPRNSILPDAPITGMTGRATGKSGGRPGHAKQLRIYYLSKIDVNDVKTPTYALLPHVTSITSDKKFATVFQWTMGQSPIRQQNGRREETFTITGKGAPIGLGHPALQFSKGGGTAGFGATGVEVFEDLHDYLIAYERDGKDRNMRLALHMPWEDNDYYVEPISFRYSSSADRSKFGFDWTLVCKAWWYAAPSEGFSWSNEENDKNTMEKVAAASAYVAEVRSKLKQMVGGYADYAFRWTATVGGFVDQISSFTEIYTSPMGYVGKIAASLHLSASKTIADIDALADATPWWAGGALSKDMRDLRNTISGWADVATYTIAGLGNTSSVAYKTLGMPVDLPALEKQIAEEETQVGYFVPSANPVSEVPEQVTEDGVVEYVIKEGDTFESVALYLLGQPADWTVIAQLNNTTMADVLWGGKPMAAGEKILVPDYLVTRSIGTQISKDPFLTDLLLGIDGDLVLLGDNNDDVFSVSGPNCLKQGLQHRFIGLKGDSMVFPNHGLTFEAGTPGILSNIAQFTQDVKEQMLADPRVERVENMQLIDEGAQITLHSTAIAVSNKSISIVMPVQ